MKKKEDISKIDLKTWEEYTKNPKDIFDKEKNNSFLKKNKRFKFDLHGYTLEDANKKVEEIVNLCRTDDCREILLITGKGLHSNTEKNVYSSNELGKLRYSIPEFIKSHQEISKFILSISEAEIRDGGAGAILIKLKSL